MVLQHLLDMKLCKKRFELARGSNVDYEGEVVEGGGQDRTLYHLCRRRAATKHFIHP